MIFKVDAFIENARLLQRSFGITPLLYGSLGLEYLTGKPLGADDVDILIPRVYITAHWAAFKALLEENGYTLIDEHEHTFIRDGIEFAYAQLEGLSSFAGVSLQQIQQREEQGVRFLLLTLAQYLRVYTASSKDGYRITTRNKKDHEKILFIESELRSR